MLIVQALYKNVQICSTQLADSGHYVFFPGTLNVLNKNLMVVISYLWNQLPVQIRDAQAIKTFQKNCQKTYIVRY